MCRLKLQKRFLTAARQIVGLEKNPLQNVGTRRLRQCVENKAKQRINLEIAKKHIAVCDRWRKYLKFFRTKNKHWKEEFHLLLLFVSFCSVFCFLAEKKVHQVPCQVFSLYYLFIHVANNFNRVAMCWSTNRLYRLIHVLANIKLYVHALCIQCFLLVFIS